jgi:very-short-patch-repair endonuclease
MPPIRPTSPHASRLRRDATDCEQRLWQLLRNRGLDGFKFRRQATIGPYVVDFLCAQHRLIVEVDGGQHNEDADRIRTRFLKRQGYHILRFWNHEVVENIEGVIEAIRIRLNAVRAAQDSPSPNPLPQAGEG